MLRQINNKYIDKTGACVKIKDAAFPAPFEPGLEYSSPARGTWNIVHTTMLVPESHQIYVCAAGCLRGVVLTAAEMHALDRFSSIVVGEHNLIDSSMESLIIDGVGDILARLPKKPKVIFVYLACIHRFLGSDAEFIFRQLRSRYPDIGFSECWMDPIMRKSGLTAEMRTRWQLYSFLKPQIHDKKSVNIIGNNLPTKADSELVRLILDNGFTLHDITLCRTYEEYLAMGQSAVNVSYNPQMAYGASRLEQDLGQKNIYVPLSFDSTEIVQGLYKLADCLGIKRPDYSAAIQQNEESLLKAKKVIADTPIAIDYAATFRPFSLAKLLLQHGFNVVRIYTDSISNDDKADFIDIKSNYPMVDIYSTINAKMRVIDRHTDSKILAVGQKAAYFTGTKHFVDIAECGGYYGFSGVKHILELMSEAFLQEKEPKDYIQVKGWGCNICR